MKYIVDSSNYTQTEVANLLGISQPRFNQYLTDKREPDISFIISFCKFFQITPNDLLGFGSSLVSEDILYNKISNIIEIIELFFSQHKINMEIKRKAQIVAGLTTKLINIPKEEYNITIKNIMEWELKKRIV